MRDLLRVYFKENYKTTAAGLTSILLGARNVADSWSPWNDEHMTSGVSLVVIGIGLLYAADTRKLVKVENIESGDRVATEKE